MDTLYPQKYIRGTDMDVPKCPFSEAISLINYTTKENVLETLHQRSTQIKCDTSRCMGSLMSGQSTTPGQRSKSEVVEEAKEFITQYLDSNKSLNTDYLEQRMSEIASQVGNMGYYDHTLDELKFGVKLAWRNASRCIMRIQYNNLELQDCRHINTTKEMFQALCNHLKYATNNGNIRSMITVFPPRKPGQDGFRMWNPQLVNFAGYLQPDESIIGDPGKLNFTIICQRLGWQGKNGKFDVLPWVLSAPGEDVQWYEVPEELILRVRLEHPQYSWFLDMGIDWYAVPAVADMMLDLGGLAYTAAPFNGWYMGTEIGARNLCDVQRYNLTQTFAKKLGLDMTTSMTLWKDTVLVEVNKAVLYSFQKNKVTIVDHHTTTEAFMKHYAMELKLRGGCSADWVWIVPPISGSITPVFHQEMLCYSLKPSYEYQPQAWINYKWPKKVTFTILAKCVCVCLCLMFKLRDRRRKRRIPATILYATETGKSETLARKLPKHLSSFFSVQVLCMDKYDLDSLHKEQLLFIVTSTFGSGEPPDNGKVFWNSLTKLRNANKSFPNLRYSVFALGSSQYATFCKFGKNIDKAFEELGSKRILDVRLGDEQKGQEQSFDIWLQEVFEESCRQCQVETSAEISLPIIETLKSWDPNRFRLVSSNSNNRNIVKELARLHGKDIIPMTVVSKAYLQPKDSERQTLLVRLDALQGYVLKYEHGDHLGIFPSNSSHIVKRILAKLLESENPEDLVQLETFENGSWHTDKRLPPASVRTYLTKFLDITSPPNTGLLQAMSNMATDPYDKHNLKRLAEDPLEFELWVNSRQPHLAELLEEFPSVKMNASLLLHELPYLQPRYYSVSSDPSRCQNQVHLTMALVSYETRGNKGLIHHGVCTNFIHREQGEQILCFTRSSPNFRLPKDNSSPILMIATGAGIGPCRGLWQNRDFKLENSGQGAKFGDMILVFGCRQAKVDNIYEKETAALVRKGVLSKVFTALSREPGKSKEYVQHVLLRKSNLVWDVISRGGHIYVCGTAMMANDVKATLTNILGEKLNMDIHTLLDQGRYHEDVFGVARR